MNPLTASQIFSRIRLEALVSVKLRTGGIHVVMTKPSRGAVEYRSFQIYSTPAPVLRELLGHISAWYLAGSIDYRRRDRSLVELARFRLRCLELDDQDVAEAFGLEVGPSHCRCLLSGFGHKALRDGRVLGSISDNCIFKYRVFNN
jgi:hypothetical protein